MPFLGVGEVPNVFFFCLFVCFLRIFSLLAAKCIRAQEVRAGTQVPHATLSTPAQRLQEQLPLPALTEAWWPQDSKRCRLQRPQTKVGAEPRSPAFSRILELLAIVLRAKHDSALALKGLTMMLLERKDSVNSSLAPRLQRKAELRQSPNLIVSYQQKYTRKFPSQHAGCFGVLLEHVEQPLESRAQTQASRSYWCLFEADNS